MKLQGFTPVLYCQDIEGCLDFYCDALSFVVIREQRERDELKWVHMKSGDAWIMLEKRLSELNSVEHAGILLYFYCADALLSRHYIIARGYEAGDIEETPWNMQEFSLRDPEGRLLKIGERVHTDGDI